METTLSAPSAPAATCPDVQIRVASTYEERKAAFRLTYRSYLGAGLCVANAARLRITPYQLLPTTDVMIAELRGDVISTISLVRDGELGLPLEGIYAEEVAARRAQGVHLAEVSCLADRRRGMERFFGLFCDLARLMVQLAEKTSVDELLIAVHPRHAPLYRRYMAFTLIGGNRDYPMVNGNPAVAMSLNFHEARANRVRNWNKFFGERLPEEVVQAQPISAAERSQFQPFVESAGGKARGLVLYGTESIPAGPTESDDVLVCA